MKKQMKKLTLAKETVRNLDEGRLEKVVGASDGSDGIFCRHSQCLNCPLSWDGSDCGSTAC
jgi:hypothetical protein